MTIAQQLRLEEEPQTPHVSVASLDTNDVSAERHKRLLFTLRSYLPRSIVSDPSRINIANKDALAARMPQSQSVHTTESTHVDLSSCEVLRTHLSFVLSSCLFLSYDAVLVDAPCSTDRHMLHSSPAELENWAIGRFRRDRDRQISLLLQALRTVREGGVVVYATCSLSPQENDDVIRAVRAQVDKWLTKGRTGVEGIQIDFEVETISGDKTAAESGEERSQGGVVRMPFGESTEFGWMILPDQPDTLSTPPVPGSAPSPVPAHGWGPIYLCKLRRTRTAAPTPSPSNEVAPAMQ